MPWHYGGDSFDYIGSCLLMQEVLILLIKYGTESLRIKSIRKA